MKRISILLTSIALLAACKQAELNPVIKIDSSESGFTSEGIRVSGRRQILSVNVTLSGKSGGWDAYTPTKDQWITCFKGEDGALMISVAENETDLPRESYVTVASGASEYKVAVRQDYLKVLAFASGQTTIDAARDTYSLPFTTNLEAADISVSADGCTWIYEVRVSDGEVLFIAEENPSETESREATVVLTGGGEESVITVTQVPMSGYPYIIDIAALDLAKWPVYEVFDTEHGGVKVAEICKEFIYKYDKVKEKPIVEGSFTVVYPMDGETVNYAKGLVVDNGGNVSWDVDVDPESGDETAFVASYKDGGVNGKTSIIKPRGATAFRLGDSLGEGVTPCAAECREMKLVDSREGAADSQGGTSESYTYSVVKIALQYWIRENLKTTRYANGDPIPTGFIGKDAWVAHTDPVSQPACLVSGTSSTTYEDANVAGAAAARNTYGCLYNYPAIIRQSIKVSGSSAVSIPNKEDKISPDGWRVPARSDYEKLAGYVVQESYANNTAMTAAVLPKFLLSGTNVTGFSGIGSRQRGRTGGYNAALYYGTIDYIYASSTHSSWLLCLTEGNNSLLCSKTIQGAVYLRLIKK